MAEKLSEKLRHEEGLELWGMPVTGITVFRPLTCGTENLHRRLPEGRLSTCMLNEQTWLRSVAANPLADIDEIISATH